MCSFVAHSCDTQCPFTHFYSYRLITGFLNSMKKTYEPPVMEVWMIDLQRSADLLVSLSLQGNVSDFEPGDDDDLIVDDWDA